MHATMDAAYADADLFEAVRLRYTGDASMVVLLPKTGSPADLAADLGPSDIRVDWQDAQVALTLPRFEFEATVDGLVDALKQLGMRAAFSPGAADFTGITAIPELYVSDVIHKSFIALDEDGTEAAAATAIIMRATSGGGSPPITFTVDRPFLFWIEHSSTGEMLFLGQVTNPGG
jgi:serpin B